MDFDVAIIGGGPAGCAAALTLRARGLSVIVTCPPSHKGKPTETSTPLLPDLLRQLGATGALKACEPCYGILSAWGAATPKLQPAIVNPRGHSWFIHRARFDAFLEETARSQGADWLAEEVGAMDYDQGGASIFTTSKTLRARWAVLATGCPAAAARLTSQTVRRFDSLIAFWAHLHTKHEERLLRVEAARGGWWYLCPDDGPGAIACFITDLTNARSLRPNEPDRWNDLFSKTDLHRRLADASSATAPQVALTGLAALPKAHGPRWLAVGDAAAKLDPLGSSGVATALGSGHRAGIAVAEALQGNAIPRDHYAHWAAGLVAKFARQRQRHYRLEAPRHAAGFWLRRLAACLNQPQV